jgi:hypothetical protein
MRRCCRPAQRDLAEYLWYSTGLDCRPRLAAGGTEISRSGAGRKVQGFTIAKWLPEMVQEYYRLSGRHEKTGRAFHGSLNKLGLEEFKDWAQLD